jgi:hypothetical protein
MTSRRAEAWLTVNRAAGSAAFRAGWPRAWNPHPVGRPGRSAWTVGWWTEHDAQAQSDRIGDPAFTAEIRRAR